MIMVHDMEIIAKELIKLLKGNFGMLILFNLDKSQTDLLM
jgi:hypothetical protein